MAEDVNWELVELVFVSFAIRIIKNIFVNLLSHSCGHSKMLSRHVKCFAWLSSLYSRVWVTKVTEGDLQKRRIMNLLFPILSVGFMNHFLHISCCSSRCSFVMLYKFHKVTMWNKCTREPSNFMDAHIDFRIIPSGNVWIVRKRLKLTECSKTLAGMCLKQEISHRQLRSFEDPSREPAPGKRYKLSPYAATHNWLML